MAFTKLQTKLNKALTTNADGDYALRTMAEGDQTMENLTITGDLTVGGQIKDQKLDVTVGSGGSVAVVSEVQSPTLQLRALGKLFDKNVLLRDGDAVELGTSSIALSGTQPLSNGDVILTRMYVNNIDNIGSVTNLRLRGAICRMLSTDITMMVADVLAWQIATYETSTSKVEDYQVGWSGGGGSSNITLCPFNLTSLGTLTADQVQMMTDLATLNDWTITGTADTWANIGTWLNTPADREAFFALVIPSHVSSMEPAKLEEIVVRGNNLALCDKIRVRETFASSDADLVIVTATGIEKITAGGNINNIVSCVFSAAPNTEYTLGFTFAVDDITIAARIMTATDDTFSRYSDASKWTTIGTETSSGDYTLTFTTTSDVKFASIGFAIDSASSTLAALTNIQLNEGSTANTYATPLDAGIEFGNRSANELKNGNYEYELLGWTNVDTANSHLRIITGETVVAGSFTPRFSGWYTFGAKNLVADAKTVKISMNSVESVAVQGDADPTWSVESVELVAGTAYAIAMTGSENLIEFQVQIMQGERASAEFEDKGYIAYNPLELLTCPDNAGTSTVSDELISINGVPNIKHNVTDNRTDSGDPEIDPTELSTSTWINHGGVPYATFTGGSQAGFTAGKVGAGTALGTTLDDIVIEQGKRYRMFYNIVQNSGTVASASSIMVIGPAVGAGAGPVDNTLLVAGATEVDFIATISGTFTAWVQTNQEVNYTLSGFTIMQYNIQENLAPNLEDISAFVNGSLIQETTEGQNHIVSADGVMLSVVHSQGLAGVVSGVQQGLQSKLDRSEYDKLHRVRLTTVNTGMTASTPFFFAFSLSTSIPDLIPGAALVYEILKDTDVASYDIYDNGIVITPGGSAPAAADVLIDVLIEASEPLAIITVDFS